MVCVLRAQIEARAFELEPKPVPALKNVLTCFHQGEEIRLSNSNNDPLPVPHIINLTASCVNVSLEGVEAFDRTVAQVTRHVSSLFLSEHTALFRLHLIMSETESAREGYY